MNNERIAKACICCGDSRLAKAPAVLMPFVAKRALDHEPVAITTEWGMRDLKPGMAYSLCNSIQCTRCGALFLDLRFSDTEMASLYAGYRDEEYTQMRERFEPGYRKISEYYVGRASYVSKIEDFLRPLVPPAPALLDWGGDTGINTLFKDEAHSVHIYDISNKGTVEGVEAVDLATVRIRAYDLITCCQVLEHVPYPREIIREVVSMMKAETLLYLEVPYEELMRGQPGSRNQYLAKRHWHEHINFFSEVSLLILVETCGLKVVELRTINISLGWRDACVMGVLCKLA